MKPEILYVDDERQNLVAFKASFRKHYTVHTAPDGMRALQMLQDEPGISVIISDQRMPQMTGVQLFERVLDQYPDPIRMVLTGYSDKDAIIDAINKGKVYYFISKPWKHEELKLIIDKALESYQLKQQNRSLTEEKTALLIQTEQQQKENILSRFETLKNQVNPHFLFNSLNALSSLVHEDPDVAEDFIAKLTRVYRYVLDLKEETLVPLSEELHFIQNFIFLQQTRFGENLRFRTQIDPRAQAFLLPPLTLQLLVENAIKHNIISQDQSLLVEVFTEDSGFLVVRNSFQPRPHEVDSTGIGLQNLRARYAFLSSRQPDFFVENDHYIARVPLLRPGRKNPNPKGNAMSQSPQ